MTAESANLRKKPTTNSPILLTVEQGGREMAVVLKQQGNWMFIYFYNTGSNRGWIHNKLIEHVKTIDLDRQMSESIDFLCIAIEITI